jgi:hypothetical protein
MLGSNQRPPPCRDGTRRPTGVSVSHEKSISAAIFGLPASGGIAAESPRLSASCARIVRVAQRPRPCADPGEAAVDDQPSRSRYGIAVAAARYGCGRHGRPCGAAPESARSDERSLRVGGATGASALTASCIGSAGHALRGLRAPAFRGGCRAKGVPSGVLDEIPGCPRTSSNVIVSRRS